MLTPLYKINKLNHIIKTICKLHNLTFQKNITKNKKFSIALLKCDINNNNNNINKMNDDLTAKHDESSGDDSSGDCYIVAVYKSGSEPGTSSNAQSKKESNNNIKKVKKSVECYVENDFYYRHTRYSCSLSNVCLHREEHATTDSITSSTDCNIRRHFSTGDVHQKKEELDRNLTSNFRKWIPTKIGKDLYKSMKENVNGKVFTLMNYNVLAQDLITEHAYIYKNHSPHALLWETRWKNLYDEITCHNADIICLQEVQESHINHYYDRIARLGYGQLFKRKTGQRTDGCALYYRKDMFNLIDYIFVEYYQSNTTVLDRENVAIVAVLAPVDKPDFHFVVATTHLLYNPRRQDVRVAQTQVLLAEVERMAFKGINVGGKPEYYPTIITGDFNSEPDSCVVQFMLNAYLKYDILAKRTLKMFNLTEHQLKTSNYSQAITGNELIPPRLGITDRSQHLDLLAHRVAKEKLSRSRQEELIHLEHSERKTSPIKSAMNHSLFSTGVLTHQFIFKDAFPHFHGREFTGTTYQDAWITVDYIFYSTEHNDRKDGTLKLLSRYSVPTVKQLNKIKHIPNYVLGSDHLSLLAKFKLDYGNDN